MSSDIGPFKYVLFKVAARCNIDCSYCYWFADKSVYEKPKRMQREVVDKFFERLQEHIDKYELDKYWILLHGGEPTLWGIENARYFFAKVAGVRDCRVETSMTTNGTLINEEWASLLAENRCGVTVSLDGPPEDNDKYRKTFQGGGTYEAARNGILLLQRYGVDTSILAVANVTDEPGKVVEHFVSLGVYRFDILVPEANYDKKLHASIARYYKQLFDIWLDTYSARGVNIRTARTFAIGSLGGDSHVESLGYGPLETCTLLTDGTLEPLDVLRFAGFGHTASSINIFEHALQDVNRHALWQLAHHHSVNLPKICESCHLRDACGGGYMPNRYSSVNGYDNPSVYCEDYKEIFSHVWKRLNEKVSIRIGESWLRPRDLAAIVR